MRFRAWGLYTQGDGNGTRGEKQPFFMMRLRTPNGFLTSTMVHTIATTCSSAARPDVAVRSRGESVSASRQRRALVTMA